MSLRILVLSPWFPYPPDNGSRIRAFHLLKGLRAQGHILHLVAGVQEDAAGQVGPDGAVPAPLAALCESVTAAPWQWYDGGAKTGWRGALAALVSPVPRSLLDAPNTAFADAVQRAASSGPFDATLAFELGSAPFLFPELPPVVADQIEVSPVARAVRLAPNTKARLQREMTRRKSEAYWRKRLSGCAAVTAVSEEEADAVRGVWSTGTQAPPVSVLPNGVDICAYPPREWGAAPVPGRLLYNGALTYGPNRDAVLWFVQKILPIVEKAAPDAHLSVTGRVPKEDSINEIKQNSRVRLTGFLPDLNEELANASVCVVPLQAGGGTRLKILEAWAAGVPVVSTTIGAAGLDGKHNEHLLIADTAEAFADATIRLLGDAELRARLAKNARTLAAQRYDWAAIAQTLSALLEAAGGHTKKRGEAR